MKFTIEVEMDEEWAIPFVQMGTQTSSSLSYGKAMVNGFFDQAFASL